MTDEYKADIAPFLREGYFDITPFRDGGVLKKILKTGEGEYPQEGCPCFVQFVGRLLDG